MGTVLSIVGLALSFAMIKFRESIGNAIGEASWMRKVGGVYTVVVFCAIVLFFWCLAFLTGTEEIFFKPIMFLLPGAPEPPPVETF